MDADVYFAEHIIRDRLAEARARAKFAALLGEPHQGSLRARGFGHRLLELGRSLVKRHGRKAAGSRRPLGGGADDLHGETAVL
jgi:hypothetical protein